MSTCKCQPEYQEVEMWLPSRILGPGYEVSDKGRGRSLNFHRSGKTGILKQNHSAIYPRLGRVGGSFSTHALIADAFLGPRPKDMEVNHRDGNKLNNRLDNLEYCTPKENIRHSILNGLAPCQKGSNNPMSKITEDDVREIRSLNGKMSHRLIGLRYGITQPTVTLIIQRKSWAHIK